VLNEKQKDRVATAVIRVGGILVILVVVAIVFNIGLEAMPLFVGASSGALERLPAPEGALAAGSDPRRELVWVLTRSGRIMFPADPGRAPIEITAGALVVAADHEIDGRIALLDASGRVTVGTLRFRDEWADGQRTTSVRWRAEAQPLELGGDRPWAGVTATAGDDGGAVAAAAWDTDGSLVSAAWDAESESWTVSPPVTVQGGLSAAAISQDLVTAAIVGTDGDLRVVRLPELDRLEVEGVAGPIARVRFLIGGGTLVAAGRDGAVAMLLEVPRVTVTNRGTRPLALGEQAIAAGASATVPDNELSQRIGARAGVEIATAAPVWRVVRTAAGTGSSPTVIAPGHRRRDVLVGAEDGSVALYYSTSGRRLLVERWSDAPVAALALDPKGDGAVAVADGELLRRSIANPHPEVSLRTLFLPVHYEGYAAPKWVWQSTGGSDASEPKLSLWPLIFGTLKATLYALLFSVPLALMAAVYVSQLAPGWLQAITKPTLEMMAAVPSVVVGFLAALWLAPRLEAALLAAIVGATALPLSVLVALAVWRIAPAGLRRRMPAGGELVVLAISAAGVVAAAVALTGPVESAIFGGDFQRFLFTEWGIRYDQRNSLVVGIALGFAVIPVIFTIAEDACSAVPQSLVSASRALGATRWQTAVRLVVPAASPGLFAAVMLGLGRAVGETMIVLMAAGNTPLLDLSAFNGMRTMSAAIAVEIPEAPVGSTLFRVLFLTGTLLFAFTLVVTTAADLVGSYLRKRYARF
jgi:phosphate transport system permease protein